MENGGDWIHLLSAHWPDLTAVAVLCYFLYIVTRALAGISDTFSKVLGPLGAWWRNRRVISNSVLDDLSARVTYLDTQVKVLRYRDECYFAYMLTDQEWHRKHELLAAENGWNFDRHITFLEFRERWLKERGLTDDKELAIWL